MHTTTKQHHKHGAPGTYPVVLVVAAEQLQHLGLLLRLRHPQHALVDTPVLAGVLVADLLRP